MSSDGSDHSDIYRDDRNYDKCKWERAWGEFNAALHADVDSNDVIEMLGSDIDNTEKEVLNDIIETFNDIAEKHNVERFEECWNGEVEECDDHSVDRNTDQSDARSVMTMSDEEWEHNFDAICDVSERWEITPEDAESFLEKVGYFDIQHDDLVTDGGLRELPFSKLYDKHYHRVFPTIRRRDKYGSVGTPLAVTADNQHLGEAEILAKETVTIGSLSTGLLCHDCDVTVSEAANHGIDAPRQYAVEHLQSFYHNRITFDEELTMYWLRWIGDNGGEL